VGQTARVLHQWLKIDQYPDLTKDHARFPTFSAAAATDLRTSLDLTLQNIVTSPASDYRELLLTDKVYLNGRLAKIYGRQSARRCPVPAGRTRPDDSGRGPDTSVSARQLLLYQDQFPIHRGVLLARSVMGRTLQPPPAAFAPLAADLHPNLTTRQRSRSDQTGDLYVLPQHDQPARLLDGEVRRHWSGPRDRERQPVDTSGGYTTKSGKTVKFTGSRTLRGLSPAATKPTPRLWRSCSSSV
jgi:hypothetical protein